MPTYELIITRWRSVQEVCTLIVEADTREQAMDQPTLINAFDRLAWTIIDDETYGWQIEGTQ